MIHVGSLADLKVINFYQSVAEHKDICKLVVLLTSAVNSQRKQTSDVLKQFHPFKVVWAQDRDVKVKVCVLCVTVL